MTEYCRESSSDSPCSNALEQVGSAHEDGLQPWRLQQEQSYEKEVKDERCLTTLWHDTRSLMACSLSLVPAIDMQRLLQARVIFFNMGKLREGKRSEEVLLHSAEASKR